MKTKVNIFALLALCFVLLCFKNEQKKITIYSIGDSTMCDFEPSYLSQFGGIITLYGDGCR